jgi:predicted lysophospholipase L1 biosynthesis ABC-type transport system permease subunit
MSSLIHGLVYLAVLFAIAWLICIEGFTPPFQPTPKGAGVTAAILSATIIVVLGTARGCEALLHSLL